MNRLEEKIISDGRVLEGNVLKVDCFLNHQIDIDMLRWIGEDFKRRFEGVKVDKILTIESSGIALASMTAFCFNVPVLFAKKTQSVNVGGNRLYSEVDSFTHKCRNRIFVSAEYLSRGEKVLIIDDFLATGSALEGLLDLVSQAGAEVAGIGIAIEKGFQTGGKKIRDKGYRLESLAVVEDMDCRTGEIKFRR